MLCPPIYFFYFNHTVLAREDELAWIQEVVNGSDLVIADRSEFRHQITP